MGRHPSIFAAVQRNFDIFTANISREMGAGSTASWVQQTWATKRQEGTIKSRIMWVVDLGHQYWNKTVQQQQQRSDLGARFKKKCSEGGWKTIKKTHVYIGDRSDKHISCWEFSMMFCFICHWYPQQWVILYSWRSSSHPGASAEMRDMVWRMSMVSYWEHDVSMVSWPFLCDDNCYENLATSNWAKLKYIVCFHLFMFICFFFSNIITGSLPKWVFIRMIFIVIFIWFHGMYFVR